jgi:hypothetical protein
LDELQTQFTEQSKRLDLNEKELLELRKFKGAFESVDDGEEQNIRLIRQNYGYQDQANTFYEYLLIKRAQSIKLTREIKSKELEANELGKKCAKLESQLAVQKDEILEAKKQLTKVKTQLLTSKATAKEPQPPNNM